MIKISKGKLIIWLISISIGLLLIGFGVTYYFLGSYKECKECEKCKVCEKPKESITFADEYFKLESYDEYDNTKRGAYLVNAYFNIDNKPLDGLKGSIKYKNFISELDRVFGDKTTTVAKDTKYTFIDEMGEEVYIILKKDGTYNVLRNACSGYAVETDKYKIYNNEIVVLTSPDFVKPEEKWLLFLYTEQRALQTLSYGDCSIYDGDILINK